jgi:hypothetical protein
MLWIGRVLHYVLTFCRTPCTMWYSEMMYLCKLQTMLILVLCMLSLLSCPRACQLYRTESLHRPRLPVRADILRNTIEVTVCDIVSEVLLFLVLKC